MRWCAMNKWMDETIKGVGSIYLSFNTNTKTYICTINTNPQIQYCNIHICTIFQYLPPPIDIDLPATDPVEPTSGHWVVLDFLKFVLAWRSTMRMIRWQNRSSDGINDVDYDDMRWKLCNQLRIPTRGSTLHCIPMHSNAMQCNAMELL